MDKLGLSLFFLTCPILAAAASPTRPPVAAKPNSPDTAAAYKLYTYSGERYRDPFIPVVGEARYGGSIDRPPSIASLTLKGIVQDAKGRIALLTSGYNSYIVRRGRLYDGRNHMVKGISGIVKAHSVVLIGSDRMVRELKEKRAL